MERYTISSATRPRREAMINLSQGEIYEIRFMQPVGCKRYSDKGGAGKSEGLTVEYGVLVHSARCQLLTTLIKESVRSVRSFMTTERTNSKINNVTYFTYSDESLPFSLLLHGLAPIKVSSWKRTLADLYRRLAEKLARQADRDFSRFCSHSLRMYCPCSFCDKLLKIVSILVSLIFCKVYMI